MTKQYYECHVTCNGDKDFIEKEVERIGWTFSCIDKDIVLGDGVKCYATHHFNSKKHNEDDVMILLTSARDKLKEAGIIVQRIKIELVLFDERYH